MATKSDRHFIVLLCSVVAADATAQKVSVHKRRAMTLQLRRRFPGLSRTQRQELVGRALRGMPEMHSGVHFLQMVEKQSKKLAATLETDTAREEAMLCLLDVALSDEAFTPQVQRVLKTAARPLGMADQLPETWAA